MSRWTCWYWRTDYDYQHDAPVPQVRCSDDLNALRDWAQGVADSGNVAWIKVFATADERDERFRWPLVGETT